MHVHEEGGAALKAYRDTVAANILILDTRTQALDEKMDVLSEDVRGLIEEIRVKGRPNWQLWLSAAGVGFAFVVGTISLFWFIINTQITATVSRNASEVAALVKGAENQNGRIENNYTKNEQLSLRTTRVEEKLKEIETQFRASDETRNLQHVTIQRKLAELQDSLYEMKGPMPKYPNNPFYEPHIAKPSEEPITSP